MSRLTRSTAVLAATLAVLAPALAATATAPAGAAVLCHPGTGTASAPWLVSPCDGATVGAHDAVVFTVYDPERVSAADAPYLDLQTSRTLVDGHLAPSRDGDGIFAQMTAVPGRPHLWRHTATVQGYASWWDNRAGTDDVQIDQVDPRLAAGIVYGPITTVRVR